MNSKRDETGTPQELASRIASGLGLDAGGVAAVIEMLDSGDTIPFIARYRKERSRGLDEVDLRRVEDELAGVRKLEDRRGVVMARIEAAGALTDDLRRLVAAATTLAALEEIYRPFKSSRPTRASKAEAAGLAPLADVICGQAPTELGRVKLLASFVSRDRGVDGPAEALAGACDILAARWSLDGPIRRKTRRLMADGSLRSRKKRGYAGEDRRFEDWYEHDETLSRVPSHRFLAMRRGQDQGALTLGVDFDRRRLVAGFTRQMQPGARPEFHDAIADAVLDCCKRLLTPSIETELLTELKGRAESEAVVVFADNLRDLLLAPPAGSRMVLGVDPGFRSGCKLAVVDGTGRCRATDTVHPHSGRAGVDRAKETLRRFIETHRVELVAIGNGTASRETAAFVDDVLSEQSGTRARSVVVSEAGASVWSASEDARAEHPELDVTLRGALSIARRLQDPLAELVRIDPRAIGVGQYQHDLEGKRLERSVDRELESCVSLVGADVNTASVRLLERVAGIGPRLAREIVSHREKHGRFESRSDLMQVSRFGAGALRQSGGFLRVRGGPLPLDDSAVHPERYALVGRMAESVGRSVAELVGSSKETDRIEASDFVDGDVGLPTIEHILDELARPGRDPRREFRAPSFAEGVRHPEDLVVGMRLEGNVTNVTGFGFFVDIGVHRDGLVHRSRIGGRNSGGSERRHHVGDLVEVEVVEVDHDRERIALALVENES